MSKFKVGDYVYFCNCQFEGEVLSVNDDGTYTCGWCEGNNSGSMTTTEDDMELAEKPDYSHEGRMKIILDKSDNFNANILSYLSGWFDSDSEFALAFSRALEEVVVIEE